METFDKAEQFDGFSKVVLVVSDDIEYSAGTETGRTLTLNCPWGSQEIANNILQSIKGFQYQPLTASGALIDPSAEIGDGISANGVYSGIYSLGVNFNSNFPANVSAPADEELEEEHPYISKREREVKRKFLDFQSRLTIQDGKISAEVEERKTDVKTLRATLEVQSDQITAKVNRFNGSSSTFGWQLETDSWRIFSGTRTVLKADKDGLEVRGKVVADSGMIGGLHITSDGLTFNNHTWGGTNSIGIYLGIGGIQLGDTFSVDMFGNFRATSGIFKGDITADSGTIGGFNIGPNELTYNNHTWYSDSENGIYIGPRGIKLGNNFKVDAEGNLTATNGTFTGRVQAGNINFGGSAGYLTGSAIDRGTLNGNRLEYQTINTNYISQGIRNSLGYADFANGVFSGWNSCNWITTGALVASNASIKNGLSYGYYDVVWRLITDKNGNQIYVLGRDPYQ